MKKVILTCTCGYSENRKIEDDESLEGLACPNCDEPMREEEE